ncbi:MAG: hypothetical protein EOM80_09270 [Erysipelotrichia bacterium]|nr:hypothetical protein [Erysipelotrichia bacterium]
MKSFCCSYAGTIREQNQDFVLVDEKLRLTLVVDGNGPAGTAVAKQAAERIRGRVSEVAAVTGANESLYRLQEAVDGAAVFCKTIEPLSSFSLAALWFNRGVVSIIASGRCTAISTDTDLHILRQSAISAPIKPEQNYLLCSEGFTPVLDDKTMQEFLRQNLVEESLPEAFNLQAAAVYDGDDRSAVLVCLEPADLRVGEPREIVLFEHYDKEYSFPVWALLSVCAAACAGIAATLIKLASLGGGKKSDAMVLVMKLFRFVGNANLHDSN